MPANLPPRPFLSGLLLWASHLTDLRCAERADDVEARTRFEEKARSAAAVLEPPVTSNDASPPFHQIASRLELSREEREIIGMLLAFGGEPRLTRRLREAFGLKWSDGPTLFDLTMLLFGAAADHRYALLPLLDGRSRLRQARLVAPAYLSPELMRTPVALTRPALSTLLGIPIEGVPFGLRPRPSAVGQVPHYAVMPNADMEAIHTTVNDLAQALVSGHAVVRNGHSGAAVLLWGAGGVGKTTVALEIAHEVFGAAVVLDGAALAVAVDKTRYLNEAVDLAILRGAAVVMESAEVGLADRGVATLVSQALRASSLFLFALSTERHLDPRLEGTWNAVFHLEDSSRQLATSMWEAHFPFDVNFERDVELESLAERYQLGGREVGRAARQVIAHAHGRPIALQDLERSAQAQLSADFGGMVTRVVPRQRLSDLVLPASDIESIEEIIAASRNWHHVMGAWGLGERLSTGRCIACLFSGEPGTGKTFAAEIIAGALGESLLVVSLPSIMSKWMGESERNVRTLFSRARSSDAVLLFDEADTLFTQRVEVSGANDAFRNMLTGLLLQELDRHTGTVVLTTNLSHNIDQAFHRRIMFFLEFPNPDEDGRRKIWQGMIPHRMPVGDIDFDRLARLYELSGGEIRNVVVRAAMMAWERGGPLGQAGLEEACHAEYRRKGRLIPSGHNKKRLQESS